MTNPAERNKQNAEDVLECANCGRSGIGVAFEIMQLVKVNPLCEDCQPTTTK